MIIFLLIYFTALLFLLYHTREQFTPLKEHDRALEYEVFQEILETGKLVNHNGGLIYSCLLMNGFSYFLAKRGLNKMKAFNITPCIFYAFMPAFVFLIASLYFNVGMALMTCLFLVSHYFLAFASNTGRVGIAWGILAGLIWSILTTNFYLSALFAFLLPLSHYGTAYYTIYLLGLSGLPYYFVTGMIPLEIIVPLAVLIIVLFIWQIYFIPEANRKCIAFLSKMVGGQKDNPNFTRITSREPTIISVMGQNFQSKNVPQKIEFAVSWFSTIVLSCGLVLFLIGDYPVLSKILSVIAFSTIILALLVPHISRYYGLARVHFTSLLLLSPCFIIGASSLASYLHINSYIVIVAVIVLLYECVSGQVHTLFGINKRAIFS